MQVRKAGQGRAGQCRAGRAGRAGMEAGWTGQAGQGRARGEGKAGRAVLTTETYEKNYFFIYIFFLFFRISERAFRAVLTT